MIHQYENNGFQIVLDINSGSVHVVDEVMYRAIPLLEAVCTGEKTDEMLQQEGRQALMEL